MLTLALALAATPVEEPAMAAAVGDLCHRQVALLGEGANHGDGRTQAFKVELVRRLVRECGYRAVFFEAGFYDFHAFSRALAQGNATPAMVSSAIGGLWNKSGDFQPLISFLFERAQAGKLMLGGIDDNLGSAGAFYSLDAMPVELAAYLPDDPRAECAATLGRRIRWDYSDDRPNDRAEQGRILACLDAIRPLARRDAGVLHLIDNFRRFAMRDFLDDAAQGRARDATMYWNFRWLAARLPKATKIIVWAATVHLAKDSRADRAFPAGGNFGSLLHRDYGRGAFTLGFSALGGTARQGRREIVIPVAAPGSLEALVLNGPGDSAYAGLTTLAKIGTVPGAAFRHEFVTTRWASVLDGLVVFRAERLPLP